MLGAFIGPLFGVLIADFYYVKKEQIVVDDLYTLKPDGAYWYDGGYNRSAVMAVIPAAIIGAICVLVPGLQMLANFTWFVGLALGFGFYLILMRQQVQPMARPAPAA